MLKLYDYYRSTASYRVRIALNLKQLPYELVPVHLVKNGGEHHDASYQTINPQQLVPTLDDHGHIVSQSLAIIEYINDLHPEPPLIPQDALAKAYVNAIALMITADIHPLNNLRVLNYLKDGLNMTETQKTAWYHHWLQLGFSAIEKKISTAPYQGEFCYGDTPTLADICLIPQLYNAKRFAFDLQPYPTIRRIEANCKPLNAFIAAIPQGE